MDSRWRGSWCPCSRRAPPIPGVATQSAERLVTPTPTTAPTPSDTDARRPDHAVDHRRRPTRRRPTSRRRRRRARRSDDAPVPTTPAGTLGDRLDVGDAKPARDYDDFVRLALNDIEAWWARQFPAVYGEPFEPLAGGVYRRLPRAHDADPRLRDATSRRRTRRSPSTRRSTAWTATSWSTTTARAACSPSSPPSSGRRSSASCSPTSSATPSRPAPACSTATCRRSSASSRPTASPARGSPTSARAAPTGLTFTDDDVRSGLVAMITVRDPIGVDQFERRRPRLGVRPGRRVPDRLHRGRRPAAPSWSTIPLPLVPNIVPAGPIDSDGNADFGYGEGRSCGFIPADLQAYWARRRRGRRARRCRR